MTLSRRLLALFVLFCGPALLLLWLSASQWLGGSLERIRTMVEDGRVDQVYSHFGYFVADWQRWLEAWNRDSDALNYVRNPDPAYEQQRLREEMLQFNHIHLMLIFDARQQLVFQRYYPHDQRVSQPLPAALESWVRERFISSGAMARGEPISGISMLADLPAIFAAHRLQGTPAAPLAESGYLVMAQKVDEFLLGEMKRAINQQVVLERVADGGSNVSVEVVDRAQGWLTRTLFGLREGELFQLAVAADLAPFEQGRQAVVRYVWLAAAIVVLLSLLLYIAVRWLVTRPVLSLQRQLARLDPDQAALAPMAVGGCHELSALADHFSQLAQGLHLEKARAQTILAAIADAVIATDLQGRISYLSPVAEQHLGLLSAQAQGQSLEKLLLLEEEGRNLSWYLQRLVSGKEAPGRRRVTRLRVHGRTLVVELSMVVVRDGQGQANGLVLVLRDISRAEQLKEKLRHQANHDQITGLYNRQKFEELLELLEPELLGGEHALCYIDLTNFKIINETCGHAVGDQVLQDVAHAIRRCVRDSDLVARMGGDEFALLLRGLRRSHVMRVLDKLAEEVRQLRLHWNAGSYQLDLYGGVSFFRDAQRAPKAVLSEADAACYVAKQSGERGFRLFDPDSSDLQEHQQAPQWAARIQDALEQGHFELMYQEITALRPHGGARHIEILLRLRDHNDQLQLPKLFMPVAERYHLMAQLDRMVIEKVFAWLKERREQWSSLLVCVNLSGETLASDKLVGLISRLRRETRVPARCICFEITETVAIRNQARVVEVIRRLRHEGFTFALDDFGSGFSSYGYLKELPVDFVKIDGAFVRTMHINPKDYALVKSIQEVCQVLGMRTVAEFVENDGVLDCVRRVGIDYAQGYGISRPRRLRDFVASSSAADVA